VTAPRQRPARKLGPSGEEQPAPGELTESRSVAGTTKPAPLRYGAGRWQWINVWAAWCKPCKEEMPRLLQWRDRLKAEGVPLDLSFLSIDDDEREMTRFMSSQPQKGVRASYWLKTEKAREAWFESIGFDDTPELPIHALVAPNGKLTCVIKGALEPTDYEQLARVFKGRKVP
jgi:thiol-disulfide isomerase/thioredoxin